MNLGFRATLALAFTMLVTALMPVPGMAATATPEKARRYLDMLRQRPQFGVVFERFLDAWYEESTPDALAELLIAEAAKPDATAGDQLLLALFETRRGNETAAVTAFKKGLAAAPANPLAWQELARLQMRMLDFSQALESLNKALEQKPDKALTIELEKQRGRVLLRTGKPEDALAAWRKLLEANADDEDLAEEVVDVQLDEGLYTEAQSLMRSLIEKTKDPYAKVTRRLRLADIHLRAGMKAEALEELAEVIRSSGSDTWIEGEALAQTDQIFRREDDLSGLAGHLEKLSKEEDKRIAIKRHLARVYAETGLKDQALTVYKDLLSRTPGRRDLREGYLDLLERFDLFSEAIPQTRLLLEQNPGDKELHLRLAAQQQRTGDAKAAGASLDAYLAMPGTAEYDYLRVAMLLENWDRKDEANATYAKLIAAFPQSISALEAHAHFLHRTGSREQALAIWKDLAAKGDRDQVLSVSQALLARLEAKAAHEVLLSRLSEFGKDPRYLAPLLTAAISLKEQKTSVPLALDRVRLTTDPGMLEDAIRQAVQILDGAKELAPTAKALQEQPSLSIAERCLLATLLEESGEKEAAERTLREADASHAMLAQTRLVGLIESRQDWPRASQELEKLLAMPEGRTSQHLQRLVNLKERSGEPEAALKVALEWKTLSPGSVQAWLTEASLQMQLSKPQDAIKTLRAASRKFEDNDDVAAALAQAYVEAGQFTDAERIFMRLVENAGSLEDKLRWVGALAQAAQSRNAIKEVTERFQERQRSNREDATPWLALAEIARVTSNEADRRRYLSEATRLRPKDIDLLHQIARLEEEGGNLKQALATLEKATALDTGWRTKQAIAMTHLRSGDEDTGFRLLGDLMGGKEMEPKDAIRLAEAMMARDQWEKAATFLAPLVEKHPDDYRLRYMRAAALVQSQDTSAAIQEFLKVAAVNAELPEVLKRPALVSRIQTTIEKNQIATLERTAPPGAPMVYRTMRQMYDATRYRQRADRGVPMASGLKVPVSVEMARAFAVGNLIALGDEESSEDKARIASSLEAAGIEQAAFFMSLRPNPQSPWNAMVNEDALLAHPEDPLVYMYWVEYNGGTNNQALPIEHCQKAFALLKDKYPLPAFRAALAGMKSEPATAMPMLEQAVAGLEKMQNAPNTMLTELARVLGGGQNFAQATQKYDLQDDFKEKVRALMMRNFLLLSPPNQSALDSVVMNCANACRLNGAWEDYIKIWNHYVKLLKAADPAAQTLARNWSYTRTTADKSLLRPLPFPTSGALPGLFSMMMRYTDPINPQIANYARPGPEDDYDGILPLLERVEEPAMRIALAYKAGQSKRAEEELLSRVSREDASLDDLLLAASYAGTTGDHDRAAALLMRTQAYPMEAARRAEVDSAMVHAVTNAKEKPAQNVEAGQQAARRLRSAKLDGKQRNELADAFDALGLKEEAEQWKKLASLAPAPSNQRSSSGSYSRQATRSRLDKALSKGDQSESIKAFISEIKTIRSEYWSGSSSYAIQEGSELVKKLNFPDARTKLVAALDPGEGAPIARLEDFGALLEIVGEKERARKVYENLLQRSPETYTARLRLIAIVADQDPKAASTLLEGVPLKALNSSMGSTILELCNENSMRSAGNLTVYNAIAALLEKHAGDDAVRRLRTELDWIQELPPILARRTYSGGKSLPYMFAREGIEDRRLTQLAPSEQEVKTRLATMDRLCKAMMLHPRFASEGFTWHAGLFLQKKGNPEELASLATDLLKKYQAYASSGGQVQAMAARRFSFYEEITSVWRPTPGEFLVWRAWKDGKTASIDSEILPMAQLSMERSQFALLKAQARVWTCTPEDFPAAADGLIRATQGASGSYRQLGHAVWLMDRWEERGIRGPVLDKAMVTFVKNAPSYNEGSHIHLYFRMRSKLAPEADAGEFLNQLLTISLGPRQDQWAARMTGFANARYGRGGSYNDRDSYNTGTLLSGLAERTETKGIAVRAAISTGLIRHSDWVRNTLAMNIGALGNEASSTLDFLQQSEFLNDVPTFRAVNEERLIHVLLGTVRNKSDVRKAVLESLKSRPQTFGVELAQVMMQQNVSAALSEFLIEHKAQLANIPPDRAVGLTSLIKANIPATNNMSTLDLQLKEALQPLFAGEIAGQQSLVERWMAAKNRKELDFDDSKYEAELVTQFTALIERDRKKAIEFFNHACKLMEAREATENWDTRTAGNGWTLRSGVLSSAIDGTAKLSMLAVSMQLYHEDATGNLTMAGWSQSPKWGQSLYDSWKAAGGPSNTGRGTEAMLTALKKELGDTPTTLLPLAFYDFFNRVPVSLRIATLQWAEKPTGDAALAPLAKELALAGRFYFATEPGARVSAEIQNMLTALGGVDAVWQHESARLRDERLNPRVRLALAHHLCYRAPESVPADIASTGAQLALEAQQKLHSMHGYQYGWILKAWCRLPANDEWKNLAEAHWKAWETRANRRPASRTLLYEPHDWPNLNILRMAAHAGNEGMIQGALQGFPQSLSSQPSSLAILAGEGRTKEAVSWTRTHWPALLYPYDSNLRWNADVARNSGQWKTSGADADIAFLCELLVATLPDPPKADQATIPNYMDRRKRLLDLAGRMKNIPFLPVMEQVCLEEFGQHFFCYESLASAFDKAAARVDIDAVAHVQNSQESVRRLKPVVASISRRIWNGDPKPALAVYDKALAVDKKIHPFYREAVLRNSVQDVFWSVPSQWGSQKQPDRKALLVLVDHVLKQTPEELCGEHVALAISLKLVIHHLEGQPEAFNEWRKTLSVERAGKFKKLLNENFNVWALFEKMNLDPKYRSKSEERAAVIGALLKDEWIAPLYPDNGSNLANLVSALTKDKAFKPEELPAAWKVLAEAFPRKGRTAGEAADTFVQRGLFDDSLAAFDFAISQTSTDYATSAGFICRKAELLERLNRDEEATTDLLALDEAKMSAGAKTQRAAILKRMQEAAKEAAEAGR